MHTTGAVLYAEVMEETRLSVRVEPALKATVERLARKDRRSLTGQVEFMLLDWLEIKGIPLEPSAS